MKTIDGKLKSAMEEIKISLAIPEDFDKYAELSEDVRKRGSDEVDWEHSYVGKLNGEIVWFFLFSTDREYPDKFKENEEELPPVELIDAYCDMTINGCLQSIQYKFWEGDYKRIFKEDVLIWKPLVEERELLDRLGFIDDYNEETDEVNYWLAPTFFGTYELLKKTYG